MGKASRGAERLLELATARLGRARTMTELASAERAVDNAQAQLDRLLEQNPPLGKVKSSVGGTLSERAVLDMIRGRAEAIKVNASREDRDSADEIVRLARMLTDQIKAGVHRNPTLAILGNPEGRRGTPARGSPRGALSESAGLDELIVRLYEVANRKYLSDVDRKKLEEAGRIAYELWHQARRGVHANPGRKKIARRVLAIDYVHASDGKKYTHDFTEDTDHGAVCAYVEDGGRRVVLESADGKPIVGDY